MSKNLSKWLKRWVANHRRPMWDERLADGLEAALCRWQSLPR